MKNKITRAFDKITTDDHLKEETYTFLQSKTNQKKQSKKRPVKRFATVAVAFAACVLIYFAGFYSYRLYNRETTYVDLDVNPSIELAINRFDRVIGAYAYNDEGKKVLKNVDIKNETYEDALTELVLEMAELGYLEEPELFTATLQTNDTQQEKEKLKKLQAYIDKLLQSQKVKTKQEVFAVDSTTKNHAHEENLTPAKYLAILELQAVDSEATFDNSRDNTISEIKEECHDKQQSGSGSGHHGGSSGSSSSSATEESQASGSGSSQAEDTTKHHAEKKKQHHGGH